MFVRVHIHGKDVLHENPESGELQLGGFHTSRMVQAATLDEAKRIAIRSLREELTFKREVKNSEDSPPKLVVEETQVVDKDDQCSTGFVFYHETEDPRISYYVRQPAFLSRIAHWWRRVRGHLTMVCS